jgi:pyridoxal phosphate phosphatase PHOSPHO2
MSDIFDEIITNPASFTDSGLLEINRRVLATAEKQHSCKVGCSANMCKGEELEAFLERRGGRSTFDRIAYIGDGTNDFCPLLRLTSKDLALVRFDFGLARRIAKEGEKAGMTVPVKYWDGAWEVELAFQDLV